MDSERLLAAKESYDKKNAQVSRDYPDTPMSPVGRYARMDLTDDELFYVAYTEACADSFSMHVTGLEPMSDEEKMKYAGELAEQMKKPIAEARQTLGLS